MAGTQSRSGRSRTATHPLTGSALCLLDLENRIANFLLVALVPARSHRVGPRRHGACSLRNRLAELHRHRRERWAWAGSPRCRRPRRPASFAMAANLAWRCVDLVAVPRAEARSSGQAFGIVADFPARGASCPRGECSATGPSFDPASMSPQRPGFGYAAIAVTLSRANIAMTLESIRTYSIAHARAPAECRKVECKHLIVRRIRARHEERGSSPSNPRRSKGLGLLAEGGVATSFG